MALFEGPDLKLIPTKKGGFREETLKEYNTRREKEEKEYDNQNINRIIKRGFTRKQAKYLYELEITIRNGNRVRRY